MRILLISEYFYPKEMGGGEKSAFLLAKTLVKRNAAVSVLTSHFKDLKEYEEIEGIKIYRKFKTGEPTSIFGNIKRTIHLYFSAKKEIKKFLAEHDFDAIHCPSATTGTILKALVKITSKRTLITMNGLSTLCPKGNLFYREKTYCTGSGFLKCAGCLGRSGWLGKLKMKFYMKYNPLFFLALYLNFLWRKSVLHKADKLICYSKYIKDVLLNYGVDDKKIEEIPSLINKNNKKEDINVLKKIKNKVVIASISTLDKLKGVEIILKAFFRLENKECVLLIAGDGSEKERLIALANSLNIQDRVFFLGGLNPAQVKCVYEKSDIIVLMALSPEAFSRLCVESAFYGKPFITTKISGGNKDGVIDGETGYVIDPDELELEKKLSLLAKDKNLRIIMGNNAKKLYRERYETNKTIKKILKIYENGDICGK